MLTRIKPFLFQRTAQPTFAANPAQTVAATPKPSVKQALQLSQPLTQDTFQLRFGMLATHQPGGGGRDDGDDGRHPFDPYANQGRDSWNYEQPLLGGFNPGVGEHGQFEPEGTGKEQEPAEEIKDPNYHKTKAKKDGNTRQKVLYLALKGMKTEAIMDQLKKSRPTINHHLQYLRENEHWDLPKSTGGRPAGSYTGRGKERELEGQVAKLEDKIKAQKKAAALEQAQLASIYREIQKNAEALGYYQNEGTWRRRQGRDGQIRHHKVYADGSKSKSVDDFGNALPPETE